jgi:hypothetical protein
MTIEAPIDMVTFTDAVYAWFNGSTGLTTIWSDQASPIPDYPYGSLKIISGPVPVSSMVEQRWEPIDVWIGNTAYVVGDYVTNDIEPKTYVCVTAGTSAASGGPLGPGSGITDGTCVWDYVISNGPLLNYAAVPCTFVVSCQTYVERPASRSATTDAFSYMNKALGALGLDSYLAVLRAAGVAVHNKGPVQNISEVVIDATESRVSMDITFGVPLNAKEFLTYIEQTEIKSPVLGLDFIVSL